MSDRSHPLPVIRVARIEGADPALPLPAYASAGAAGADLRADLGGGSVELAPGARSLIPTGLRLAIPEGWEVQIRPRSGLALKQGITLLNTPGTIDSDYRGPLGVILVNLGEAPVTIAHGDRIAQMVVAPAPQARFELVEVLDETERGGGGFGSTGRG
ncbi:dUTP diphosphatase [uncultured Paracoccus sp.]|uniref:dUTP diphosphatase n=1 Tax=uncultured Paracoccus sp. TaxID=189685 RepID=UPI00260C8655|nr:dUTP diphosphatase [uncultured Paracoccus sp.]